MASLNPWLAPVYATPEQNPQFATLTPEERENALQMIKYQKLAAMAMESCPVKMGLSAGAGFGLGAFFSLMSSSFAYEDPLGRAAQMNRQQKIREIFADMGRGMWRGGKGFAMVGGLFAGTECVIEGFRAKHDIYNALTAGFLSGGILARNAGPKAMIGGGLAFAAFSGAIDYFINRESADDDYTL